MKRRDVIAGLGGLTFFPPSVAQTATVPLVGFLNAASPDTYRFNADSFRKGLRQAGFIEGARSGWLLARSSARRWMRYLGRLTQSFSINVSRLSHLRTEK